VRERIISSGIVVVAGLAPTLIGGPLFAISMVLISVAGYREYLALATHNRDQRVLAGTPMCVIVLAAMSAAGLASADAVVLFAVVATAVAAPLVALLAKPPTPEAMTSWTMSSAGLLYLGLPVYAAVALRSTSGTAAPWLTAVANTFSLGWHSAPAGLAWALVAILTTWIGDSTAFLTGRFLGGRRLAPSISPGKTVEGAIGGLFGSAVVGGAAFSLFGIGPWWIGVVSGSVIGIAGQIGDLCESFFKRQAEVKDSGTLLPGHGGILDRIDALFFAFPVSLVLAATFERLGVL
jgi:phosphatidate cytidylyltransferase